MVNKKAAMELSMSTIVILVLAMSMLILGLVLIKAIFGGAKSNVDQMNQKVADEIAALFTEEQKIAVNLANNIAKIKQGDELGVGFVVKNQMRGASEEVKFRYEVEYDSGNCKLKEKEAMAWIALGNEGSIPLAPGQAKGWTIRFEIPETAPLCMARYNIKVYAGSEFYISESFDLSVEA